MFYDPFTYLTKNKRAEIAKKIIANLQFFIKNR